MAQKRRVTGDQYKISVTGSGISIKRTIPRDTAQRVLLLVMGGETNVGAPAEAGVPAVGHPAPSAVASAAEMIAAHHAGSNPEKIAVLGVRFKVLGRSSFNEADLRKGFVGAGETTPKNLPRDIKETIKKGWIDRMMGEENAYYVTRSGEEAVRANFQGVKKRASRSRTKRGRRRAKTTAGSSR